MRTDFSQGQDALRRRIATLEGERDRLRHQLFEDRRVFDSLADVVWVAGLDGHYRYVSQSVERVYGYSPDEMRDLPLMSLLTPEAHEVAESVIRSALAGPPVDARRDLEPVHTLELRIRRKDGRLIWAESRILFLRDESGRPEEILGVTRDISERKRLEDELRQANRRLEQALDRLARLPEVVREERLRSLGNMASGVAHDFNNALTVIAGFTDLLLAEGNRLTDTDQVREDLRQIHIAANDAAAVVKRLSAFYRDPSDEDLLFQTVDLSVLAEEVIRLAAPKLRQQTQAGAFPVRVVRNLTATNEIAGHPAELRELLTNLLFNAVDAMPRGGVLKITTASDEHSVTLSVEDSGVGMSEETRLRCLEPFFTTKGEDGTGLGLAIAAGIVRRHHGSINVQSAPGKGTRFDLRFPVLEHGPAFSTELRVEDMPRRSPTHLNALVVSDDEGPRAVLAAFLNADGHDAVIAEDGAVGLQIAEEGAFDLIFTEASLPDMSGDAFAEAVNKLSVHTPVVLVTGFPTEFRRGGGPFPTNDVDQASSWNREHSIRRQDAAAILYRVLEKPFSLADLRLLLADVASSRGR